MSDTSAVAGPRAPSDLALDQWHRTVVVFFGLFGVIGASVLARLPEIKSDLDADTSRFGFMLLATAVGALCSLQAGGKLVERLGTRPAILGGLLLGAVMPPVMALAITHGSQIGFVATSFLVGCSYGLTDVAINIDGSAIEQRLQRTVMTRMHAAYSIGTIVGAGVGTAATATGVGLVVQICGLAAIQATVTLMRARFLPRDIGKVGVRGESPQPSDDGLPSRAAWRTAPVVAMGVCLALLTMGEGSANDWLAIGIASGYEGSRTAAGVVFVCFNIAMTLTRFFGGRLVDARGRSWTLRCLAAVGAAGVVIVMVCPPTITAACVGATLWGVGVALGFPVLLSAAGAREPAAARVAFVAVWGYGEFLAGPPLLGVLGHHIGVLGAFSIVAACLVAVLVIGGRIKERA